MEQCYLMPGQERCERFKDANGVPRVHYSYRSLHGAFLTARAAAWRKPSICVRTGWSARTAATATDSIKKQALCSMDGHSIRSRGAFCC